MRMWFFKCILCIIFLLVGSFKESQSFLDSFDKVIVGGNGGIQEDATKFSIIRSKQLEYENQPTNLQKASENVKFAAPFESESFQVSGEQQREKRQQADQGQVGVGVGQRDGRSFIDYDIGPGPPPGAAPLCFEREVSGTCRYRSSPEECFRYEWTGYATFVNVGYKEITSIPKGLHVFPGGHARVRVYLKSSCCNHYIQFVATDLLLQSTACIVDVRELQDLHPGEIAGIVVGVLIFFLILIALIAFCMRRQRNKRFEKRDTVIFGRSLTRSKSTTAETTTSHNHP